MKYIIPVILLSLAYSCNYKSTPDNTPVACFTISTPSLTAENPINFVNCSKYVSSYHWDFDDSTTSNEENPAHIYKNDRAYNVTLTVTNSKGQSKSFTKNILVLGRYISKVVITKCPTPPGGSTADIYNYVSPWGNFRISDQPLPLTHESNLRLYNGTVYKSHVHIYDQSGPDGNTCDAAMISDTLKSITHFKCSQFDIEWDVYTEIR